LLAVAPVSDGSYLRPRGLNGISSGFLFYNYSLLILLNSQFLFLIILIPSFFSHLAFYSLFLLFLIITSFISLLLFFILILLEFIINEFTFQILSTFQDSIDQILLPVYKSTLKSLNGFDKEEEMEIIVSNLMALTELMKNKMICQFFMTYEGTDF
jgi:hypothetical protein